MTDEVLELAMDLFEPNLLRMMSELFSRLVPGSEDSQFMNLWIRNHNLSAQMDKADPTHIDINIDSKFVGRFRVVSDKSSVTLRFENS
jgi:hypothetical protein